MQQSEIGHHFFRVCFQQGLPVIFIVVPFYEQPFTKTHCVPINAKDDTVLQA